MQKIVFATGNKDKMREIRMIMEGLPYEIISMKEAGINPEIIEDGTYDQLIAKNGFFADLVSRQMIDEDAE